MLIIDCDFHTRYQDEWPGLIQQDGFRVPALGL